MTGMDALSDDYLTRFSEAVVQEIWNELGRQRITSLRELARRAGMTHTSVIVRLNGDSRTGKKVVINVRDLAAFGQALGVEPAEFVARAKAALELQAADPATGSGGFLASIVAELDPDVRAKTSRPHPSSMEGADIAAREEGDD